MALLLGAGVGSFLNVCLYRWKSGGQVVTPSSFCPKCKHPISPYDNIPVLSYLLLAGKCRHCGRSISLQYPLVEALSALLFALSSAHFLGESPFWVMKSYFFVSFLVLLGISDLKWRLLPHVFNNLFALVGLIAVLGKSPFSGISLMVSAGSFLTVGALLFGLLQIFPNGLGGGDIKMAAALSVWMGQFDTYCALILSCILASLLFGVLYLTGNVGRKWKIPFGSFLAASALALWFMPDISAELKCAISGAGS